MNKYVCQFFAILFQSKQPQQLLRTQSLISAQEWCEYWQAKGFPWRTEPEIDAMRQQELSKCRAIIPDIEKGM